MRVETTSSKKEAARSAVVSRRGLRVRFDRNELSGAFGDIGTDFPLVVGMILVAGLDPASVLTLFGLMQIMTGLIYGMPMPVQPLKAMAVLVIAGKASREVLFGGGLAVGVLMLTLAATGLIDVLARAVPKTVIRGIQFALGLQLCNLALQDYLPAEGALGWALGALAFVLILALLGNRRFPPAPFVIGLGIAWAFIFRLRATDLIQGFGLHLPQLHVPQTHDIWTGLIILALPQLALSLGNSILATRQIVNDLFPERPMSVRKISFTYAAMNLVNPFFSGVPTCHGSGGMAGHYTFGGRTGGSVIIYGFLYVTIGIFLSGSFGQVIRLFPKPILGMILLFEALALMRLARDTAGSLRDFALLLFVAVVGAFLPYGYLIGLLLGTVLAYLPRRLLTDAAQSGNT